MDEARMARLAELFDRSLAIPPSERAEFVQKVSGDDEDLRQELSSLLDAHDFSTNAFDDLAAAVVLPALAHIARVPEETSSALVAELEAALEGSYRIERELGGGAMSRVFLAEEIKLGRKVVIKVLPPELAVTMSDERFRREIQLAAQLQHPHIVPLLTSDSAGRLLYYTMPFIAGESLRTRLEREGPLPLRDAVRVWRDVLDALGHAHARKVVHRDIKPANILLGERNALVTDFGIARAIEAAGGDAEATAPGLAIGTPAYMAPEQVTGDRGTDHRVDIYAAALVIYEMLEGRLPFAGGSTHELVTARLANDPLPILRADCPPALATMVLRCLSRLPAGRPESAEALLAELETLPSGTLEQAAALPSAHGASQPRAVTGRRAVLLAGSTILLVTLAVALVWSRGGGERSLAGLIAARAEPSIAVLPLANLSGDSSDGGLAAGMTEALIATLARAGDLRVIASTSSSRFRDREMDVRRVADSLGVSNILEGGVQKIGSQLRVHVRLVAGRDGATRWSQAYDRDFNDVFAVQDEIVQAVAAELELRFDKDRLFRRHQTRSIAAYELFLRGSDPLLQRSVSGVWKALQYFQQAIAADSTYAAAYAELAAWQVRRGATSDPGMPLRDLFALAEGSARKAVALDDSLAEAHFAVGRALGALLKFQEAEQEIRRAIALDPTRSLYRFGLANLNVWYGRSEEELAEARAALETDPLNPVAIVALARGLFSVGRYDEALAQLDRVAAMQPPMRAVAFVTAQCYAKQGRLSEAIAALRPHAEAGDPMFRGMLGHMLARAGQRDEANRVLADLRTRWERTGVGAFQVAIVHAGLGDIDQAFAWLDKSIDDLSIGTAYVGSDIMGPTFEDLHRDPRFQRLRRRLGLQG